MDHSQTKEKIIQFLNIHGPSIPVRIAKEIEQSILFTSAFLSELLSEKRIITSHLRVGSSPIYFIPGQELQLEKYSEYVKGKEKEAFILIKGKKFLDDEKQQPAIRVALRSIKDFAIPFQKENKLYWRYFKIPENEFKEENKTITKKEQEKNKLKESKIYLENIKKQPEEEKAKEEINIFDEKKEKIKKKITKKTTQKTNEKFFDKIKEFLTKKQIEISGIEGFSKNDLTLKIKENNQEKLLIAYSKKKITEIDIINAYKKAKEQNLNYILLLLGEPQKKLTNLIEAIKKLDKIEKIE